MNKNLPNAISISRIVFSISLLAILNVKWLFCIVYLLIGISDFLDGYLARKYKLESEFGAKLDSISDLVFFSILTILILTQFISIFFSLGFYIIVVVVIRIFSIILGLTRFKKFVFVHTIANKVCGVLVYIVPLWILFIETRIYPVLVLICCFVAALEESIILVMNDQIDVNTKSIFHKK
jgi:phosphatidylserine synthase